MSVDVVFFPNKDSSAKLLGGGYIKVSGFQIRFNVWKSDKTKSGFTVQLPSRKLDNGNWIDDVEIIDKDVRNSIYESVSGQLNKNADQSKSETRASTSSAKGSSGATKVSIGANSGNWSPEKVRAPF